MVADGCGELRMVAVALLVGMGVDGAVGVGTTVTICTNSARSSNVSIKSAAWVSFCGVFAVVSLVFITGIAVGRTRRGTLMGNPNNANPWTRILVKSAPNCPIMFSSTRVAGTNSVSIMANMTNNITRWAICSLISMINAGE
jgi:hypothetical protein